MSTMPSSGRALRITLLRFWAIMVCLHRHHVSATPSEDAVLAQLKNMWKAAPSVVKLWVDAVDACHGPWPGVGCAFSDNVAVEAPCFVLDANCTVVTLRIPNGNLTGEIPLILAGLSSLEHLRGQWKDLLVENGMQQTTLEDDIGKVRMTNSYEKQP